MACRIQQHHLTASNAGFYTLLPSPPTTTTGKLLFLVECFFVELNTPALFGSPR